MTYVCLAHDHLYSSSQYENGFDDDEEDVPPRKDFPETGTPNAILHEDDAALVEEPSERALHEARIIPMTETLSLETEDWLDTDAAR